MAGELIPTNTVIPGSDPTPINLDFSGIASAVTGFSPFFLPQEFYDKAKWMQSPEGEDAINKVLNGEMSLVDFNNLGSGSGTSNLENDMNGELDFQRNLFLNLLNNSFNADQVEKQWQHEKELANTGYLRAAAQLKELGINPLYLISGGSQAETPNLTAARAQPSSWSYSQYQAAHNLTGLLSSLVSAAALIGSTYMKVNP